MSRVFCNLNNSFILKIDREIFCLLENYIIESGEGSDKDSFDVIKQRLISSPVLNAEEFAFEVFYVILASGFRQKVAKRKFLEIEAFIKSGGGVVNVENLMKIFGSKPKMSALVKVWENRLSYRDGFYNLSELSEKMEFLKTIPFIGEITKNHLARNLGINEVKYDLWIRRLGVALGGEVSDGVVANEGSLSEVEKKLCDDMFDDISKMTGYPVGYVDVVLWKACQIGLLSFSD